MTKGDNVQRSASDPAPGHDRAQFLPALVSHLTSTDTQSRMLALQAIVASELGAAETLVLLKSASSSWGESDKVAACEALARRIQCRDRVDGASIYDALRFMVEVHGATTETGDRIAIARSIAVAWANWTGKKDPTWEISGELEQQGNTLMDLETNRLAVVLYSAALIFDPLSASAYFNRGVAHYNLGEFDAAVADYDNAASLSPNDARILNNRGDAHYRLKDYASATEEFTRALRMDPTYFKPHFNMGLALSARGDHALAAEWFGRAIMLRPAFGETYVLRAAAYEAMDRLPAAIRDYQKALELEPNRIEAAEQLDRLRMKTGGSEGVSEGARVYQRMIEHPRTTFADVVGLDDVKAEIRATLIDPLVAPDLAIRYGIPVTGGILLYGPPGCGKTLVARAAAGEAKRAFYPVDLTVMSKWIGETENNLRDVFAHARMHAPAVIFIDEIDGLAASRESEIDQAGWERKMVNQLLIEMSRLEAEGARAPLLVIGATNQPWLVDESLRRAGRIGTDIFVPGPDLEARVALFSHHLDGKPSDGIDVAEAARLTSGFSPALIKWICQRAARPAWNQARISGGEPRILMEHLRHAIREAEPDILAWLATARSRGMKPRRCAAGFRTRG
jgi:transitional endoplasmic reticulum ATPase